NGRFPFRKTAIRQLGSGQLFPAFNADKVVTRINSVPTGGLAECISPLPNLAGGNRISLRTDKGNKPTFQWLSVQGNSPSHRDSPFIIPAAAQTSYKQGQHNCDASTEILHNILSAIKPG